MCKSILKGQNVPGTDGTYHGTDGTCPRDRRDAHRGCPAKILYVYCFFFFPNSEAKFSAIPPLLGLSLDCARPVSLERSGGVAAIVCDTTGNTVRQGYCYTCLAIGGYFGRVTKTQGQGAYTIGAKMIICRKNCFDVEQQGSGWPLNVVYDEQRRRLTV